jgi:RNA polymerase sigma-70 factor, ECF subfamily
MHSEVEVVIADASPALLAYFLRRVEPREDAADLLGETLEAAWKSARRLPREAEAARMWLFGIARNVLLHHHRSTRRRAALVERLGTAVSGLTSSTDSDALDVRAAVASLPSDLAELIRLVHWDGFSIEQAAAHMRITGSTARTRHARAKHLLQESLADFQILT